MNRRLLWLIGIAGLLGIALVSSRSFGPDVSSPVRPSADRAPVRPTTQSQLSDSVSNQLLQPLAGFDQIWKRPVFSKSRIAPAFITPPRSNPATNRDTVVSDQPPDFSIVGIAIRPDGGSVMIRKNNRETLRVRMGEEIDGWLIEGVAPTTVTLSRDGESWQLPVGTE